MEPRGLIGTPMRLNALAPSITLAIAALTLSGALSGCGEDTSVSDPAPVSDGDGERDSNAAIGGEPAAVAGDVPEPVEGATPMDERVATIGLLNKRNNVSKDFELKPGESVEDGPVIITLAACERTAPYELPSQTGAFVQVDIMERRQDEHSRVFSGWLFKDSPSINVVEHPIYDVWVKDCAMTFPGEESGET